MLCNSVDSRMRFLRDPTLIRLQTGFFLESAATILYENV